MIDIKNVLKAWECCVPFNRQCNKCPYDKVCYHDGFSLVATSHAMTLLQEHLPNGKCVNECECWDSAYERGKQDALKEQEPRMMAPTEAYTADFVYVEFDGVITPALRTSKEREGYRESYFATQQLGGEWMRWDDYGITWRCWTSRPTNEQRKMVKWE